jgi:multimeric flavodoxin WrbA
MRVVPPRGTGTCVLKDDMDGVLKTMVGADVIALATPVYFYTCAHS